MLPELPDLERVFQPGNCNPFAACTIADQETLKSILIEYRADLRILAPGQELAAGRLYVALDGRVTMAAESLSGRRVGVRMLSPGGVFGETGCAVGGLAPANLGLRFVRASSRSRSRSAIRVLEIAARVVDRLLQVRAFERALFAATIERQRLRDELMYLRFLNEAALAVAHLCVSPTFGTDIDSDSAVTYLGQPTARFKTITFGALADAAGLSINATRDWISRLESAGYLSAVRSRQSATRLTIVKADELIGALLDRSLDI